MKVKYLSLVVLCGLVVAVAGAVAAQDSTRNSALAFVADAYGESQRDLDIVYEQTMEVPGLGEVTRFKVQSDASGAQYGAVMDASGRIWTAEGFVEAADQAYLQEVGKLDLQLHNRFDADPDAVIPVAIWLTVDDSGLDVNAGRPTYVGPGSAQAEPLAVGGELAESARAAVRPEVDMAAVEAGRQARFDRVAAVQSEVTARLSAQGIDVTLVPKTPLLLATLGWAEASQVAQDPAVAWIYADDIESADMK